MFPMPSYRKRFQENWHVARQALRPRLTRQRILQHSSAGTVPRIPSLVPHCIVLSLITSTRRLRLLLSFHLHVLVVVVPPPFIVCSLRSDVTRHMYTLFSLCNLSLSRLHAAAHLLMHDRGPVRIRLHAAQRRQSPRLRHYSILILMKAHPTAQATDPRVHASTLPWPLLPPQVFELTLFFYDDIYIFPYYDYCETESECR